MTPIVEVTIRGAEKPDADMAAMRDHLIAMVTTAWRRAYRQGIKPNAYTATLRIEGSGEATSWQVTTQQSSRMGLSPR